MMRSKTWLRQFPLLVEIPPSAVAAKNVLVPP